MKRRVRYSDWLSLGSNQYPYSSLSTQVPLKPSTAMKSDFIVSSSSLTYMEARDKDECGYSGLPSP